MKILVTGGAGFIGSHFVDYALTQIKLDDQIVILDKLTYAGSLANLKMALADPRVRFVQGDICVKSDVMEAMSGITHLVNFAAESHVDRSIDNATEFIKTNISGTHVLLDAAVEHSITKFLQVSTDEVYGSITLGSANESNLILPNSPYAASKAAADLLVRSYHITHKLNVNVTRCSNNYGSRQFPEKIIPLFVKLLSSGKSIPIYGDGKNCREWLHVSDHCRGIWAVLSKGKDGEIYNIGGGEELTNLELVGKIISLIPNATPKQIDFVPDRKGHDFRYSINCDKIKSECGYSAIVNLDAGLRSTVKSLLMEFGAQ